MSDAHIQGTGAPERARPVSIGCLDVRGLSAYVTAEDDELVLMITDGDVEVEIRPGIGESPEASILGAQRLAAGALQYAEAVQRRAKWPLPQSPAPTPTRGDWL